MRFARTSSRATVLALAMLAVGSASAVTISKGDPDGASATPGGGGVQVAIDRDGALRVPTADETAALLQDMARYTDQSTAGLKVRFLANGTRTVNLEGRFQDVAIARMVNGQVEFACVDSVADAKAFLLRAAPRTAVALEEK